MYCLGEIRSGWCYSIYTKWIHIIFSLPGAHYVPFPCYWPLLTEHLMPQYFSHLSLMVWRSIWGPRDTRYRGNWQSHCFSIMPLLPFSICVVRKLVPKETTMHLNNSLLLVPPPSLCGCREKGALLPFQANCGQGRAPPQCSWRERAPPQCLVGGAVTESRQEVLRGGQHTGRV